MGIDVQIPAPDKCRESNLRAFCEINRQGAGGGDAGDDRNSCDGRLLDDLEAGASADHQNCRRPWIDDPLRPPQWRSMHLTPQHQLPNPLVDPVVPASSLVTPQELTIPPPTTPRL